MRRVMVVDDVHRVEGKLVAAGSCEEIQEMTRQEYEALLRGKVVVVRSWRGSTATTCIEAQAMISSTEKLHAMIHLAEDAGFVLTSGAEIFTGEA